MTRRFLNFLVLSNTLDMSELDVRSIMRAGVLYPMLATYCCYLEILAYDIASHLGLDLIPTSSFHWVFLCSSKIYVDILAFYTFLDITIEVRDQLKELYII